MKQIRLLALSALSAATLFSANVPNTITLSILDQRDAPVIRQGDAGAQGNRFGFEGGCVRKIGRRYHLFTSEMIGEPVWVKMRLAHWISPDRIHWKRQSTMYESSGDPTGKDLRASLWAPMPVFNDQEDHWNLFYISYRAPIGPDGWHGRIWRAVSRVRGKKGIDGPWADAGVILEPGSRSDPWEASQGTDSIYPFRAANGKWLGFYGSSNARDWWKVGLAEAPALAGPWKRLSATNPVTLNGDLGTENPVVTRLRSGKYVAVFDTIRIPDTIGYAESPDGYHWSAARQLRIEAKPELWVHEIRTPLGLIEEDDGTFTLFYTGFGKAAFGMVRKSNGVQVRYASVGLLRVVARSN